MAAPDILLNLVRNLPDDMEWEKGPSGSEDELREIESAFQFPFPEEYRRLMIYSNGGNLYGSETAISFFPIEQLPEFARDYRWGPELKNMFVFADDGSGQIYYMDPMNHLGRGHGSIFITEIGSDPFKYSSHAAGDLAELFERIIRGDDLSEGPFLYTEPGGIPATATAHLTGIDYSGWLEWANDLQPPDNLVRMVENLPEGAAWAPGRPDPESAIADIEQQFPNRLPESHTALLRYSGGGMLRGQGPVISLYNATYIGFGQFTDDNAPEDAPELKDFFFFGDNNASFRFCYDTDDYFGRGAGGVYAFYKFLLPRLQLSEAVYIGRDLAEVLRRVITGENIFEDFERRNDYTFPPPELLWEKGNPF